VSFQTHYYSAKQSFKYTADEEYREFLIFWFEKFIKTSVKIVKWFWLQKPTSKAVSARAKFALRSFF
ncbi:MAG: hypothetical protein LBP40_06380, partial [Campylobacteraceae bacterium]|jgi:hypothetical protein|nr:hypothetical protein [Campylobacteraceae bacterium]